MSRFETSYVINGTSLGPRRWLVQHRRFGSSGRWLALYIWPLQGGLGLRSLNCQPFLVIPWLSPRLPRDQSLACHIFFNPKNECEYSCSIAFLIVHQRMWLDYSTDVTGHKARRGNSVPFRNRRSPGAGVCTRAYTSWLIKVHNWKLIVSVCCHCYFLVGVSWLFEWLGYLIIRMGSSIQIQRLKQLF